MLTAKNEPFDLMFALLVGVAAVGERLLAIALWVIVLIVIVKRLRGTGSIPRAHVIRSRASA